MCKHPCFRPSKKKWRRHCLRTWRISMLVAATRPTRQQMPTPPADPSVAPPACPRFRRRVRPRSRAFACSPPPHSPLSSCAATHRPVTRSLQVRSGCAGVRPTRRWLRTLQKSTRKAHRVSWKNFANNGDKWQNRHPIHKLQILHRRFGPWGPKCWPPGSIHAARAAF